MNRPLEGILPALPTAFAPGGAVDPSRERRLVARLLEARVHGLFVCGTTGEFPLLDAGERALLAEAALAEAAGAVPVVVHVGSQRTSEAVELARHAEAKGASAICAVPPYYFAYGAEAVAAHLGEIARATSLPLLYYHIPERTAVTLDDALLERLLKIPNLRGMKFSEADLALARRVQEAAGGGFALFCGCDHLLLPSLLQGARGGIGSTYNFLAPLFVPLWEAQRAGRIEEARAAERRAARILDALAPYPGIAATREVLRLSGLDLGPPRPPARPLPGADRERLARALDAAAFFTFAPAST